MAIKSTIISGGLKYTTIRIRPTENKGTRRKKRKPSSESVKRNNEKLAEKHLGILLGHNFEDGDYHITLTYAKEPEPEESKKILRNYLDRLRRLYKRSGTVLKWVVVTEYHGRRLHHHLILNRLDWNKVRDLWKYGSAFIQELYSSGDYRKLAGYLIKETSKTFREKKIQKQRFRHSKSVVYPVEKVEEVSAAAVLKDPQASPGWYIDRESVYHGQNPFTGAPYLEYIEVRDGPEKYKVWPRGKRKRYKEFYFREPPEDWQLTWEDIVYGEEFESGKIEPSAERMETNVKRGKTGFDGAGEELRTEDASSGSK